MCKRKRPLTQLEIDAILFGSDESDCELSSEEDGSPTDHANCSLIPDLDSDEEIIENIEGVGENPYFF